MTPGADHVGADTARYQTFRRALTALAADPSSPNARLARFVESDPFAVAFGDVREMAEAGGVSTASVVRFAQRLGFAGFADMRAFVRDRFRTGPR